VIPIGKQIDANFHQKRSCELYLGTENFTTLPLRMTTIRKETAFLLLLSDRIPLTDNFIMTVAKDAPRPYTYKKHLPLQKHVNV
jgi:hypothetical protein